MSFDPNDPALRRRRPRPQLARRDVLRGGLWVTVGLGAAPLLAACGDGGPRAGGERRRSRTRWPDPTSPVTLPIKDSNPPIDDGLEPESGGAFKILNYAQYMAPGVMKDFGKKHGVAVAGDAVQQLRRDARQDPRTRASRSTSCSRARAC